MVPQIKKIKITIVESELEALLLEAFYINKHKPKYNVLMKDGKSYILIRITIKDDFPKVLLARKEDDPKSIYFGPFTNSSAVRLVLKTIRKIFPFQSVLNHPKKICLYHHLGLCPCPPVPGVDRRGEALRAGPLLFSDFKKFKQNYRKNIRGIIRMLNGQSKKIMLELEKERNIASKSENYEEALELQRKINALSIITTPFHKPFEYVVNPNLRTDIRQQELNELMNILNSAVIDQNVILDDSQGSKKDSSPIKRDQNDNKKFIKKLERIECYDISNIQGTNATGSMVVLTNGEIDRSQYRRFKIRRDWEKSSPVSPSTSSGSQAGSFAKAQSAPNDFAMMQEVLKRRFNHDEWHMPDLIIVDGGKGQVSAALEVISGLGIPLIGLAKREETIVISKNQEYHRYHGEDIKRARGTRDTRSTRDTFFEVSLPKSSPALHLIMRIRDEAHRFAVTYHKRLRSKSTFS